MSEATSIQGLLGDALRAYEALVSLAEDVEDEWTYVMDLGASWRERLDEVARERDGQAASAAQVAAIERLVDEARRISDPHRAIDWLSTFPQVALTALGERP